MCCIVGACCQGFFFFFFFLIKNKDMNVLRKQICWDASLEGLHVDVLVQHVVCKCPAAVALGWNGAGGVCVPLAMPCLSLMPIMSCLHLHHPARLSGAANHYWALLSRMQLGICLAAVLAPGDGARVPAAAGVGGIPRGNFRFLVSGTLARSRQAVPPILDADQ